MDASQWHSLAMEGPAPWPDVPRGLASDDAAERDAAIDNLEIDLAAAVLPYPPAAVVGAELSRLIRINAARPAGSKTIAGVSAPFSAGKSTAITGWAFEQYREAVKYVSNQAYPTWQPEPGVTARLVPVVYLSLLSSACVKELNAQILTFLGYPGEGIARVTSARVNTALRRHGVKLLIVDDAHMLRVSDRSSRQVLDYLKTINSELGFLHGTMLFVGPDLEAAPIFEDPQIRARLRIFNLSPLEVFSSAGRQQWQAFLKECETLLLPYLPGQEASGVFSSRNAGYIWHRTQGFVGDTTLLLCGAVINALRRRARTLTREDLVEVPLSARAHDAQAELDRINRRGQR